MPLPTSHKNPAVAHADHYQPREHRSQSKVYGTETGAHPNRQVSGNLFPSLSRGLAEQGIDPSDTAASEQAIRRMLLGQ